MWGDFGLAFPSKGTGIEEPVVAATRIGEHLLALTERGVSIYDGELHHVAGLELANTGHLSRAGRYVGVTERSRVVILHVSSPARPKIAGSLELPGVSELVPGELAGGTATLLAGHEGGATLLEARRQPRLLARYGRMPWTASVHVAGPLWARGAEDRSTVALYTEVRSAEEIIGPELRSTDPDLDR